MHADHKLPFSDFFQVKNSFLHHIKQADWPSSHINMLTKLIEHLENYGIMINKHSDATVLCYASYIHCHWHDELKCDASGSFNICLINKNLLNSITFDINSNIQAKLSHKASPRSSFFVSPTHHLPTSHTPLIHQSTIIPSHSTPWSSILTTHPSPPLLFHPILILIFLFFRLRPLLMLRCPPCLALGDFDIIASTLRLGVTSIEYCTHSHPSIIGFVTCCLTRCTPSIIPSHQNTTASVWPVTHPCFSREGPLLIFLYFSSSFSFSFWDFVAEAFQTFWWIRTPLSDPLHFFL